MCTTQPSGPRPRDQSVHKAESPATPCAPISHTRSRRPDPPAGATPTAHEAEAPPHLCAPLSHPDRADTTSRCTKPRPRHTYVHSSAIQIAPTRPAGAQSQVPPHLCASVSHTERAGRPTDRRDPDGARPRQRTKSSAATAGRSARPGRSVGRYQGELVGASHQHLGGLDRRTRDRCPATPAVGPDPDDGQRPRPRLGR